MLAHDGTSAVAKQFVIVKQTARNRILNGQESNDVAILLDVLEYLLERIATNQLQFLIVEELVGGNVMEGSLNSLYGYFLHLVLFNKKSHFSGSGILLL